MYAYREDCGVYAAEARTQSMGIRKAVPRVLRRSSAQVALLLLGINMPYHIIRQPVDLISRSFRHLGEPLCFRLVLESIAREVDTCSEDQLIIHRLYLGGITHLICEHRPLPGYSPRRPRRVEPHRLCCSSSHPFWPYTFYRC